MSADGIVPVGVTWDEVDDFIRTQLIPAVSEAPLSLVNASFITLMIHSLGPEDVTGEEVQEGVKQVSQVLALYCSTLRTPAARVN